MVDDAPIDAAATLALAHGARRLLVKTGDTITLIDGPLTESDITTHLVHADGFLRVPVLVKDGLFVRGYTEALYREALDG